MLDLVAALPAERFELDIAVPPESTVWRTLEGRDGVRLHPISAARGASPADFVTLRRLLPLVRRADVVHAHSSKAGFVVRLAAALTGRRGRVLFTPNGWSFWVAAGVEGRVYTLLERLAAHWCRTIVAVSDQERTAGLTARVGRPDQYLVVPNGIDVQAFAVPRAPVPGRVLMLGRLAPPKRQDLLLHAAAAVRGDVPGLEVHLAGEGPLRHELERLAGDLGVVGAVRFLGSRSDVAALLAEAACVVLASDYEGSPLALAEAMAAGAPVVVSAVGGMPELVDDGASGLVVAPGSSEALAAALRTLLSDPELAERLGESARRRARERLSREAMAAALLPAYADAAGR